MRTKDEAANGINYKRTEDLTIEELRRRNKFKDYTDEQLLGVIQAIKTFTQVAYGNWADRKEGNSQTTGNIIDFNINNQSKAA